MKQTRIVVLCLVGAFALSAFASQAAFAEAPEYGKCVPTIGGKFENAGCTKESASKKTDEWVPGPGAKAKYTTTILVSTVGVLETLNGGHVITCKGETGTGEYTGAKTVTGVVYTLTGCELSAAKCTTAGQAEGTIVTSALKGELGVIKKGETTLHNKIGDSLTLVTGEKWAEFSCATTPTATTVSIKGGFIQPISSINSMKTTLTPKIVESKGKQKPTKFEVGAVNQLESSLNGGLFEQTGFKLSATQASEEPIEVNSVA
jgi:hypothetical protein